MPAYTASFDNNYDPPILRFTVELTCKQTKFMFTISVEEKSEIFQKSEIFHILHILHSCLQVCRLSPSLPFDAVLLCFLANYSHL